MKRLLIFTACFAFVSPSGVQAQLEVGLDAGLQIRGIFQDGSNLTTFGVPWGFPTPSIRIGAAGDGPTFDALLHLSVTRGGGETVTFAQVMPGISIPLGEGGTYVRPEAGLLVASGGGDTETEWAIGVAVGTKNQIGDGPFSVRFEAGFDRWLSDADLNDLRAMIGLSAIVG